MNRFERRARASLSRAMRPGRPALLTRMPQDEVIRRWDLPGDPPFEVWQSREFLVQVYAPRGSEGRLPSCRISVCRVTLRPDGRWDEEISWDELQRVKREVGRGDKYAVEVYPPEKDVVNVANMRHLWVFDAPLECGWMARP